MDTVSLIRCYWLDGELDAEWTNTRWIMNGWVNEATDYVMMNWQMDGWIGVKRVYV